MYFWGKNVKNEFVTNVIIYFDRKFNYILILVRWQFLVHFISSDEIAIYTFLLSC